MACQQGRVFGRVRSSEKQSRHFYLMRRHSRAGGNPDLFFRDIQRLPQYGLYPQIWFAEISVAAGLLIYSRGQSPRYGCRLQIPPSRLKKLPISLSATPSFPRRRESRPLIFRNIQRLPQYRLCPRMQFAEILVSTRSLCFTDETRHIFRRRF